MARYRIKVEEPAVSIEVTGVGERQEQLMKAFEECAANQCSCPTNEYEKLASMEVEQGEGRIRLRLEPKPGESFDTSQIAACLDYTTSKAADATSGE